MTVEQKLAALEQKYTDLLARVIAVEEGITGTAEPLMALGLPFHQAQILALLMKRITVSKEAIYYALYGADDSDKPAIKMIDVHVCRLRKTIGSWGVAITTRYQYGYEISASHKALIGARLRRVVTKHAAELESPATSGPAVGVPAVAAGPNLSGAA
jgi:hypothetical protein